jgi:hypothetical protein
MVTSVTKGGIHGLMVTSVTKGGIHGLMVTSVTKGGTQKLPQVYVIYDIQPLLGGKCI